MSSNYELLLDERKVWLSPRLETLKLDSWLDVGSMTTAERTAITANNGMVVYDTTLEAFYLYQNGAWVTFEPSGGSSVAMTITSTGAIAVPVNFVFSKVGNIVSAVCGGITSATFTNDSVYCSLPVGYRDAGGAGTVSITTLGKSNNVDCQIISGAVGSSFQLSKLSSNQIASFDIGLGTVQRHAVQWPTSMA